MHEIGIMRDVLDTVVRVAEEHGGGKITKINLRVGVMSGLIPYYCRSMFEFIAKGSIAEGCELAIEEEPAVFKCLECGEISCFDAVRPEFVCNSCGSKQLRLIDGYKSQIVNMSMI